jgi:replicative DNA helicase
LPGDKMKIEVEIKSSQTTPEQNQKIAENLKMEILRHVEMLKRPATKLTVILFDVPQSLFLSGSAVDENDVEVIKITYKLSSGETKYDFC